MIISSVSEGEGGGRSGADSWHHIFHPYFLGVYFYISGKNKAELCAFGGLQESIQFFFFVFHEIE